MGLRYFEEDLNFVCIFLLLFTFLLFLFSMLMNYMDCLSNTCAYTQKCLELSNLLR
jgi:hypothetical protein